MWRRLKPARSIGRTSARRLCTARLPERVDAVVIGGGCVGSSVAYHLQQRGLQTLLLEAHALTASPIAGSTLDESVQLSACSR